MEKQKLLQNTISNRILQALYLNGEQTTIELQNYLTDIPQSTLYRYMKYLEQFQIISVVREEKIRGQIQKTYTINTISIEKSESPEDAFMSVELFLKQVRSKYDCYFTKGKNSPYEDMLFMNGMSMCLSDEEYRELIERIKHILKDYIGKEKTEQRKIRNLYIMSAPEEEG